MFICVLSRLRDARLKHVALLLFIISSCTSSKQEVQEHPGYFDAVFRKTDSIGSHDSKAAAEYMEKAFAAFPSPGAVDLFKKYQRRQWDYLTRDIDLRLAMLYADSMLYIFRQPSVQQRYPKYYGQALLAKGDVLRDQQKYKDAYPYYYKGREVIQKTRDTCLYYVYAGRLALVYYRQEKYVEAAKYYTETAGKLEYCRDADFRTFYDHQGVLDNIALSYDKAGKTTEALFYYDSTLRFIHRHGAKFAHIPENKKGINAAIGVVYGNKGNVLLKMGDTAGAEALYRQSININIRGDEKVDAQLTMAKLAGLYLAGNRLTGARAVLDEMTVSLDEQTRADIRQRWSYLQWQYYEKTGRQGLAYTMLQAYTRLKDSLYAASGNSSVADMNEEFDHMADEYRLEVLQKNNELKTAYLGILIFFSASIILIALMIWQNWRKSRRHVRALRELNRQIVKQHENIQKSLTSLEQSQHDNSRIMKIVAHDLRSPVGAIHTMSELLLMDARAEEKDVELLQLIKTSSARAISLITDLLALDTSITGMEKEMVEIDVALKYCVDLLQMKADEKRQHIILHAEPVKVPAYREKIWRVFSNLINNAIKFSPDGATIEIALKQQNGTAMISVKDEGIGIPQNLRDKVFSLSAEAKRKGTRGEESFGLGLSISKQIIEAHDGRIWFETEVGKGTTFYVEMKMPA